MNYNMKAICELDITEISRYAIFEMHGHGVMESQYEEGRTLRTIECTEFDAFIIAEAMNIKRNGIMSKRTSWESPTIHYKKLKELQI